MPELFATFHPSYLVRLRDESYETAHKQFADDLCPVAKHLRSNPQT
ncbi:MAG: hypothetical protein ABI612_00520 [Betaproteobacteria bacterium]